MSITGTVREVVERPLGASLTADVAAGGTVLPVDLVLEFSENGGVLDIDGVTYPYTTIDPDADTITLTTGLSAAVTADTRVSRVDAGRVATDWVALVALDDPDDPDTVECVIRTGLRGYFAPGPYDNPVPVVVSPDGGWHVVHAPGQELDFDGAVVWNPHVSRTAGVQAIPHAVNTDVTVWTDVEADAVTISGKNCIVQIGGWYFLSAALTWDVNSTGRRSVNIKVNGSYVAGFGVGADPGIRSNTMVFVELRLVEGDVVTVDAYQTSLAALNCGVGLWGNAFSMHRISI